MIRSASIIFTCLFLLNLAAQGQRGVDFREQPDSTEFSKIEMNGHLEMMTAHNIDAVWLDDQLNESLWTKLAAPYGITVITGGRKFNRQWLGVCVDENLKPTPDLIQLKKDYQPVQFSFSGKRLTIIKISDRFNFEDLAYSWVLTADGKSVESGEFEAKPDSTGKAMIKLEMKTAPHDKQNYLLEVRAFTKLRSSAATQGVEVAKEQFRLSTIRKKALKLGLDDKLETKESNKGITLKGSNFKYLINPESGLISSLEFEGRELLSGSIQPTFYFPNESEEYSPWNHDQLNWNLIDLKYQQSNEYLTTVIAELQLNGSSTVKMHYKFYGSGDCQVMAEFNSEKRLPVIQRFGLTMETAMELDSISWFGRGPQTSFRGANSATFIGMNNRNGDDLKSQDTTDRVFSETEWLSFHEDDEAIFFSSKSPFAMVVSGTDSKKLGLFIDELSSEKLHPERTAESQCQRFVIRIRPFIPEEEGALKLSRYHAGSMQVPRPKTAVGQTNDEVE